MTNGFAKNNLQNKQSMITILSSSHAHVTIKLPLLAFVEQRFPRDQDNEEFGVFRKPG